MVFYAKDGIMMLSKAWDCIKVNRMIEKGDRIVAGVSGGADSVCLLYVLKQYCRECGAQVIAVHVNHGIRGEEAARDEQFVKDLCDGWGIECISYYHNVREIAGQLKLSEEEAGRKVRYDTFLEVCEARECNKIAIAHNRNDNAETILFHLFRGTGLKGLSGIEPRRVIPSVAGDITIIRPLLDTDRNEIEAFLRREGISWQTDSTNLTEDYSRNKIRIRILKSAVEDINSGAVGNITGAAACIREAADYIETGVRSCYERLVTEQEASYRVLTSGMRTEHPVIQKGLIFQILEKLAGKRKDLEEKHVKAVCELLDKQVGRMVHLPYGIVAEREYDHIRLSCDSREEPDSYGKSLAFSVPVNIPGRTYLPRQAMIFETELINYKNNITISKNSCVKWFDYDKIENAVEIRTRREGDYIQINSSGGNKKLKDYYIDHKIPRRLRDSKLLVTDGSHVMWIVGEGERMSERYKIDTTTTKVLVMKMIGLEEDTDDK